jgi:hypothetical protein
MSQQAMIANGDALSKKVDAQQKHDECGPTEQIGAPIGRSQRKRDQKQYPKQMHRDDRDCVDLVKLEWQYGSWNWIGHCEFPILKTCDDKRISVPQSDAALSQKSR